MFLYVTMCYRFPLRATWFWAALARDAPSGPYRLQKAVKHALSDPIVFRFCETINETYYSVFDILSGCKSERANCDGSLRVCCR